MAFELQPHLKGELLELRPLDTDDWNELFAVASDSLIWEQHPEPDRYTEMCSERSSKVHWNRAARSSSSSGNSTNYRVDAVLRL